MFELGEGELGLIEIERKGRACAGANGARITREECARMRNAI